jgi:urocanate hydratase
MAIHNVIGDSFRGATWVSIHNGGGVGWGEVINGGFGMLLDGSEECDDKIKRMLSFDVNNGIARRAWARNENAMSTLTRMSDSGLLVTVPNLVQNEILDGLSF